MNVGNKPFNNKVATSNAPADMELLITEKQNAPIPPSIVTFFIVSVACLRCLPNLLLLWSMSGSIAPSGAVTAVAHNAISLFFIPMYATATETPIPIAK